MGPGHSCRPLALGHHEVTAANPGADQALLTQQRERALGRALRDPVLLREGLYGWQAAGQLAALDLPAEDRGELLVQRGDRVRIKAHMITLGNPHAYLHF